MKTLCIDGEGEFILAKLKDIRNKNGITIKYAAPYIYKENRLAK